ncbi:preprotein translocase subunit SecG [Sphingobium cloacae]|uniref:Protein-export membrane protein SecG n=2 Tax=Sphingobium cloacae TaxID=120107 RepID=A0A1E1F5S4_9SPHN|nr:preprotein translocase subunit SecG [Sphingobium cloacae]
MRDNAPFTGQKRNRMFTFLLVVQAIVAACLVTVILMQKSEGGGLGVGGSPAGFMSARGAADFLTRSTTILATVFVGLSITLAVIASVRHAPSSIDTSLVKQAPAAQQQAPAAGNTADPLAGAAGAAGNGASSNGAVPLAN